MTLHPLLVNVWQDI